MASFFEGEQTLTLQSVKCTGGEHNGKLKKVQMKLALTMDSEALSGSPDWASEAYTYVAKHSDVVRPQYEFEALDLEFSADQLFGHKVVKGAAASLRGFEVFRSGEGEDADIIVTFTAETTFADGMWRWLGQMQGKDFYARFVQVVEADKPPTEDSKQMNLTVN